MKKEYQKAEVKVYEMEIEYTMCTSVGTSGETITTENEGDYGQP